MMKNDSTKSDIKFIVNIKYHKYFEKAPQKADFKNDESYNNELKYYKESQFYRCNSKDNILSYLTRKGAIDKMPEDDRKIIQEMENFATFNSDLNTNDMLGYAGNRPGSTGLFKGLNDISKNDMKDIKAELKKTKSNIWSGVLSFTEEYGNLVCNKKEDAKKIIASCIHTLFEKQGLKPENVNYYCAFHTNTSHPHIHFVYWEKKPLNIASNGEEKYSYSKYDQLVKATNAFKSKILSYCESIGKMEDYSQRDIIRKYFRSDNLKQNNLNIIRQLNKRLGQHSKQYGRLTQIQRNIINNFIDDYVSSNPIIKKNWDSYIKKLQLVQKDINRLHEENKIDLSKSAKFFSKKRIDELYSRCGNEALKLLNEIQDEEQKYLSNENDIEYGQNIDDNYVATKHQFYSNTIPEDGFYNEEELNTIYQQLNQSVLLPKKKITNTFKELFEIMVNKGWNPRSLDEIETEKKEYFEALYKEKEFIQSNNTLVSPLKTYYKLHQPKTTLSITESLENDRKAFNTFGIDFKEIIEPKMIHYIVKCNSSKFHPEKYKITKYEFKGPTKRIIFINSDGKKVNYFFNDSKDSTFSFITTLKKLGLTTKDSMALACLCKPNGLAFKLITQTSKLDATCRLLQKNNKIWSDTNFKIPSYSRQGQNSQAIYKAARTKRDLINLLSHLISDKTYQMNRNINDVLKEFYNNLNEKGEISIYGEQE